MLPVLNKGLVLLLVVAGVGCQMVPGELNPLWREAVVPLPAQTVTVEERDLTPPEHHLASTQPLPASVLLIKDGRISEAENLLRTELSRNPKRLGSRTNLAILLANTGRGDEAIPELTAVLSRRSHYCPALMQMAKVRLQQFDIDAAEQAYMKCLEKSPNEPTALLHLGILYELYRGDFDGAIHRYEQYQRVVAKPDVPVAHWIADLSRRLASEPIDNQFAEVRP